MAAPEAIVLRERPTEVRAAHPVRRLSAWLAAGMLDRAAGTRTVIVVAIVHIVAWTLILSVLKSTQTVHADTAEAYAWGSQLLLGYGKHPPLSGWIAGLWFSIFPAADWAAYALAMTATATGMVATWAIAERVVDRRRSMLVLLLLAIYPIINSKGYKYNPDVLSIAVFPLIVLTYLRAFESRSAVWGLALGLAAGAGLLTKYWALLPIGAVALAALLHRDRWRFLRSPAPWAAAVACAVVVAPHVHWLAQNGFVSLHYASDHYAGFNMLVATHSAVRYLLHHAAMFLPVLLALLVAFWTFGWRRPAPAGAIRVDAARQIWIILLAMAFTPAVSAAALTIKMKSDWGIPMFFLVPLAVLAILRPCVPRVAIARVAMAWAALLGGMLVAAPALAWHSKWWRPYEPYPELSSKVTQIWRERSKSPLPVVAGLNDIPHFVAFYSADHPTALDLSDNFPVHLITPDRARRTGFVGICMIGDARCAARVGALRPSAERIEIATPSGGRPAGPAERWIVFVALPQV